MENLKEPLIIKTIAPLLLKGGAGGGGRFDPSPKGFVSRGF